MSSTGYYDQSYPPSLWGGGIVDPNIGSIAPTTAVAGSGSLVISVTGTNFLAGSIVEIDQAPRPTTYVSPTNLTATYTPTVAGPHAVTVRNGGAGGEESNSVTFTVTASELQGFAATPIEREDLPEVVEIEETEE